MKIDWTKPLQTSHGTSVHLVGQTTDGEYVIQVPGVRVLNRVQSDGYTAGMALNQPPWIQNVPPPKKTYQSFGMLYRFTGNPHLFQTLWDSQESRDQYVRSLIITGGLVVLTLFEVNTEYEDG